MQSRNIFPLSLLREHWVQPLQCYNGRTLEETIEIYLKYIKAKGPEWKTLGNLQDLRKSSKVGPKRKSTEIILDEIKKALDTVNYVLFILAVLIT